jgi:beta-glucosidase
VLPLSPALKAVAFIGPLVRAVKDNHGGWAVTLPEVDYSKFIVTQWDGLKRRLPPGTALLYAKGCEVQGERRDGFAEALRVARQADVVIVSVGETADMSGEAKSRSRIGLPGVQEDLIKALHATGKPLVVLVNAGRPLVFEWTAEHAHAVLYTWWLGSEAGNAIADVLLGAVNPSAKLPISFPRNEGQIPIYYNHYNTGRPPDSDVAGQFRSGYSDLRVSPQYAFGHGLSYTQFGYANLRLDNTKLRGTDALTVTLDVSNKGRVAGEEVVQLYLRQRVASVVRPVLELKDFARLALQPGQTQQLRFVIDREKLSFFNERLQWAAEPGEFELMVGASSADIRLHAGFELLE